MKRLILVTIVFFTLLIGENIRPEKTAIKNINKHNLNNFTLGLINLAFGRIFTVAVIFSLAEITTIKGWGLFNIITPKPIFFILQLILLDLLNYSWHRIIHVIDPLWKIHCVHHTDNHLNLSSSFRFHVLEIILGIIFKVPFVLLFGFTLNSILVYEVILNINVYFHHSNIKINPRVDNIISKVIITPYVHRIHHDYYLKRSYNFSSVLVLWDKLFKSYFPPKDVSTKKYGVYGHDEFKYQSLLYMLKQPFISNKNK